ncbi:MAG: hypothetical protein KF721_09995 [Ignavibacteriaceae bacterium]|nr:hypothetical protein [Ignavibacteriaceae bacterium]
MVKIILLLLLSARLIFSQNYESTFTVTDSIQVNLKNLYKLNALTIIPGSEIIKIGSKNISIEDYSINYHRLEFSLSDSLEYSLFDTIIVSYKTIKLSLKKEYSKRELQYRYDSLLGDTIRVLQRSSAITTESIFGSNIERSGSIVRGFTIGTNKDLSLQSGFRLQFSGNLSEDIEVVAALTDENSPIQPEGNTERLEDLEKVFIQIKHKNATGIFGDYELIKKSGEFGVINRKLQGLMGEFNYEGSDAYFSFASSKGKFHSNKINGEDGVQGPYRLSGENGERDIIIIAGTEKVFLDGEELRRGEGNDYTIDYSNAQITFTPKRLITSASRLSFDFQYTDRRYVRNFFGAGGSSSFFSNKLKFSVQYIREGDDYSSPIDILLSDEDKSVLREAGNNREKAVKSGVSFAEKDSLGYYRGIYERVDTLINGDSTVFYKYNPGDVKSIYNVSFTYVGEGRGSYIKESVGYFKFVGQLSGNYLPIIYLPLPELKQFSTVSINYSPSQDFSLYFDLAGSSFDRNRFSELNDNENTGFARNFGLKLNSYPLNLFNNNLGKVGISFRERFIEGRFTSPDRFNSIEFERDYNIQGTSSKANETLREAGLVYSPFDGASINSNYGYMKRGVEFKSNRFSNNLSLTNQSVYNINYVFDYVSSENLLIKSDWIRQKGNFFYTYQFLKPGLELNIENKKERIIKSDSLINSSLRFSELNPYLEINKLSGFNFIYKFTFRDDYLPILGRFEKESNSTGHMIDIDYKYKSDISSQFNVTVRDKKYSDYYKLNGQLDNQTILVRSQSRLNFLDKSINGDLFYEVSTQKTAKLEKVFVQVQKGNGNYIYLGDLNGNGIADEYEYEPTLYDGEFILITIPSDKLYPVIDLKTSTRWKIEMEEIIDGDNLLATIVKPLSTETVFRIEENTQEPDYKKIYLLNLSAFQNEKLTLRGTNFFQQDFFIFENSSSLSFRLRYSQRRSLTQFASGTEKGFAKERGVRIRFRMIEEISNLTEFGVNDDNVAAIITSNRNRKINSNFLNTDFSYRPQRNIEVGLKLKYSESTDSYPQKPTIVNLNGQGIRFNYSFSGLGRLRIELERNELLSNSTENFLPYELTGGNTVGKNYFWRVNFDYRFGLNIQSTASYDGRLQGTGRIIHTARAEVRAFF